MNEKVQGGFWSNTIKREGPVVVKATEKAILRAVIKTMRER